MLDNGGHKLLNAEREQCILDLLRLNGAMSVVDLCGQLGVSEATMRRDLQSMQERNLLERFHGGATLRNGAHNESIFSDKEGRNSEAKQAIARAALELISDGDIIYLDGGSTVLGLARLLEQRQNLTIVTNSLMAAAMLMETGHKLILTGGEFRGISRTLVGPLSAPVIQNLTVDKAFMGTFGITLADGISTTDASEAFTKLQIMGRAHQVILLADHTKFGTSAFVNAGHLDAIDVLVTDNIGEAFKDGLERVGVNVVIAPSFP